jgi:hypothetical protein
MAKARVVVMEIEGGEAAIADALRSIRILDSGLPGGAVTIAPAVEAAAMPKRIAAPVHRKAQVKHAAAAETSGKPQSGVVSAKILALLEKKPMTSGEIVKALPEFPAQSIYVALSQFRMRKQIQMIEDPETIAKKNKLVR